MPMALRGRLAPLLAALALSAAACGGGPTYRGEPVARVVKKMQESADPVVQRGAMADLRKAGAEAVPVWRALLEGDDPGMAALALQALGAGDPSTLPADLREPILARLAHPAPPVRAAAVTTVALLFGEDAALARRVAEAAADPEVPVRRAAWKALRALGPATAGLPLPPPSGEADPSLRADAVLAHAFCGAASPAVEAALADMACDGEDPVRAREAAWAMASLGRASPGAVERLAKALPAAPEAVAVALCDALGLVPASAPEGAAAAKAALGRARGRREPAVAVAAALGLVHLGGREEDLEKALAAGLRGDAATRVRAAEGLAHLGKDGATHEAALAAAVAAPGGTARPEAAAALGVLAAGGRRLGPAALAALDGARRDADPDLRRVALRALAAARR